KAAQLALNNAARSQDLLPPLETVGGEVEATGQDVRARLHTWRSPFVVSRLAQVRAVTTRRHDVHAAHAGRCPKLPQNVAEAVLPIRARQEMFGRERNGLQDRVATPQRLL